ncbi:hypothetical protein NKR23_g2392 [Pleurostoma richardsiae]|uniref:Uncharacterized protein n=1 Tax=Pleurostoma richardsiae TaxID=41990 RepID=A0AA38RMZ1_9PEZI|nr:hypothetical protein NKR23_g2392 [Pleurostoma richardsiae]
MADGAVSTSGGDAPYPLPRITIQFCTQCKWMLRAAYFAQELLSTFSTSLGEVALQPGTGGVFVVSITHRAPDAAAAASTRVLWDRRADGGFPETKELKRRVRDVIDPARDLGHVDRDHHAKAPSSSGAGAGPGAETSSTPAAAPRVVPQAAAVEARTPGEILAAAKAEQQQEQQQASNPPPPTLPRWGSSAAQHVERGGGAGGVMPLVPPPPEEANEAVRARLAEAANFKNAGAQALAEGQKGSRPAAKGVPQGSGGKRGGVRKEQGKEAVTSTDKAEYCEDCA